MYFYKPLLIFKKNCRYIPIPPTKIYSGNHYEKNFLSLFLVTVTVVEYRSGRKVPRKVCSTKSGQYREHGTSGKVLHAKQKLSRCTTILTPHP